MNQSELLTIISNLVEARQKSRVQGAICFGFSSHWLEQLARDFRANQ